MQKLSMSPTKNKLHHKIEHTIEKGIRMALGIRHYTCHLDVLKCALSTNISMGQNEEFLLYMLSNSFIVKKKKRYADRKYVIISCTSFSCTLVYL